MQVIIGQCSEIIGWIILIKEEHSLCSLNGSGVCYLLLDPSRAFDKVNYCKLFAELLKRQCLLILYNVCIPVNYYESNG